MGHEYLSLVAVYMTGNSQFNAQGILLPDGQYIFAQKEGIIVYLSKEQALELCPGTQILEGNSFAQFIVNPSRHGSN